jgi:hypothetical protein
MMAMLKNQLETVLLLGSVSVLLKRLMATARIRHGLGEPTHHWRLRGWL